MLAVERRKNIVEMINKNKRVLVPELSKQFEVTEETIRRDLEKLEQQGVLVRTYGGAIITDEYPSEAPIEERETINHEGKDMIGRQAAALIKDGETVFLDASTSSLHVARHLKDKKGITVITNSERIIIELSKYENIHVICIGGTMRHNNMSYVGRIAELTIRDHYYANKFFFSCRGVTLNRGLTDFNEQEAELKKAMLACSDLAIFLCDHSKFGKLGVPVVAPLEQLDFLITDMDVDGQWHEELLKHDIEVIIAK